MVRTAKIVLRPPGGPLPPGLFLMVEWWWGGVWHNELVRLA